MLLGAPGPAGLCDTGRPHLVLATKDGPITAELFEAAAPRTLKRLAELFRAPGHPAFDYTHPHVEIYTAPLGASSLFDDELDAEALGLDRDRVADEGKAMDIVQREIVPAFTKVKKGGPLNPRLAEWMTRWRSSGNNPSFLVGASRKDINEALGYVYTHGLDSRPVSKGALTLQPGAPGHAKGRLGIALADLPTRRGRQMVIGRVVGGLELADDISIRPLRVPKGMRSLDYAPRDPVVIQSIRLECRE